MPQTTWYHRLRIGYQCTILYAYLWIKFELYPQNDQFKNGGPWFSCAWDTTSPEPIPAPSLSYYFECFVTAPLWPLSKCREPQSKEMPACGGIKAWRVLLLLVLVSIILPLHWFLVLSLLWLLSFSVILFLVPTLIYPVPILLLLSWLFHTLYFLLPY